jgi:hypothetical protein
MVVVRAQRMIAQHLDHATVGNRAVGTLIHHLLQLQLKRLQSGDAGLPPSGGSASILECMAGHSHVRSVRHEGLEAVEAGSRPQLRNPTTNCVLGPSISNLPPPQVRHALLSERYDTPDCKPWHDG